MRQRERGLSRKTAQGAPGHGNKMGFTGIAVVVGLRGVGIAFGLMAFVADCFAVESQLFLLGFASCWR